MNQIVKDPKFNKTLTDILIKDNKFKNTKTVDDIVAEMSEEDFNDYIKQIIDDIFEIINQNSLDKFDKYINESFQTFIKLINMFPEESIQKFVKIVESLNDNADKIYNITIVTNYDPRYTKLDFYLEAKKVEYIESAKLRYNSFIMLAKLNKDLYQEVNARKITDKTIHTAFKESVKQIDMMTKLSKASFEELKMTKPTIKYTVSYDKPKGFFSRLFGEEITLLEELRIIEKGSKEKDTAAKLYKFLGWTFTGALTILSISALLRAYLKGELDENQKQEASHLLNRVSEVAPEKLEKAKEMAKEQKDNMLQRIQQNKDAMKKGSHDLVDVVTGNSKNPFKHIESKLGRPLTSAEIGNITLNRQTGISDDESVRLLKLIESRKK